MNTEDIPYKVVGGAALALHGISIQVKDLDIETNRSGAFRFQEIFNNHTLQPVDLRENENYCSYYGRFCINGIIVEIMGDVLRKEISGWVPTSSSTQTIIDLHGVPITCSWLEEETLAYIRRGRLNRAAKCLVHCDQSRLLSLINREIATNVI
jgi:hypothetical protein